MALLVSIICALGPYLYWNPEWVTASGAKLRAALVVFTTGNTITIHHSPPQNRHSCPCTIAAAAGAALHNLRIAQYKYILIPAVFFGQFNPLWCTMALANSNRGYPLVYTSIAEDQRALGVLDLPTDSGSTMSASRYLYYQSLHHKPIPYAPDVRASTSSLLRYQSFRYLAAQCRRRPR